MITIELFEDAGTMPASWVKISKPEPTPEGGYACMVELPDLTPARPIFGATPIDTMQNALTLAAASASRVKNPSGWRVS